MASFERRLTSTALPDPHGEYILYDHWRDHAYGIAQKHGVEIHAYP